MQSEKEMFLRIEASTIPEKKKGAVGVRGMKLNAGDALSNIYVLDGESEQTVEVKGKEVVLNRLRVGKEVRWENELRAGKSVCRKCQQIGKHIRT